MSALEPRRRKIGSRACDACKIRKVKCSEAPPCERCTAVGIACTFNKRQATRGPRSLRTKTIEKIISLSQVQVPVDVQTQNDAQQLPEYGSALEMESPEMDLDVGSGDIAGGASSSAGYCLQWPAQRTSIPALVLRLCIYRVRLFPVWPIVAVEDVISSLQRDVDNLETYALANVVGSATMAQLKLDRLSENGSNDSATAHSMEAECQRVRALLQAVAPSLNMLRISFFLHIYHENQSPGGTKSLLYLREAITLAQIMGLHRKSTCASLSTAEQQMRTRILWLLFVTERGVAMLHKLPVILRVNTGFPSIDGPMVAEDGDEIQILPSFRKLVHLFWIFDQSGAFDILQNAHDEDTSGRDGIGLSTARNCLDLLQKRLSEVPLDQEQDSNDVQKTDICVTRQWMQALLWRAMMERTRVSGPDSEIMVCHPIQIAREFLDFISRVPKTAIEAHGPAIEFKIYEIARSVTEALTTNVRMVWSTAVTIRPSEILVQLQRILASCRGGNKMLLSMLGSQIAMVQAQSESPMISLTPSRLPLVHKPVPQHLLNSSLRGRQLPEMGESVGGYGKVRGHLSSTGASSQARPRTSPTPSWYPVLAAAQLERHYSQEESNVVDSGASDLQQEDGQALSLPWSLPSSLTTPLSPSWTALSAAMGQDFLHQIHSAECSSSGADLEHFLATSGMARVTAGEWTAEIGDRGEEGSYSRMT